jgi:hypothetical protein
VTDNLATAMGAVRSERVNRTFKTVEHMRAAAHPHLEALGVLISAYFTLSHLTSPPSILYGSREYAYIATGAMIAMLMQAERPPVKEPPVKRPPEKDPPPREPPRREPPNPEPPVKEPPRQPPAEEPPPGEPPIPEPQT